MYNILLLGSLSIGPKIGCPNHLLTTLFDKQMQAMEIGMSKADKVKELNDAARQSFMGCRVMITRGVAALDCAERNITDPRARFHWADATRFKPAHPWDAVVMNPPFHISRAADPELGAAFLRAAHRGLLPGGTLWLVANRHLPYDRILTPLFRTVEEIGGDAVFRLFRAAHPIRAR